MRRQARRPTIVQRVVAAGNSVAAPPMDKARTRRTAMLPAAPTVMDKAALDKGKVATLAAVLQAAGNCLPV